MKGIEIGSTFAGHLIEGVIGRGGMGVVYRARDLELNRVAALKVIAPEYAEDADFRDRFKRESQVAASIKHPNVIAIYRAGEDDGHLFIAMEYVEGTDLRSMINAGGRLDPPLAANIIAQVAGGLAAAHARGLVHRDVKPANVLIESHHGEPAAYLTDFGLTKRTRSKSALTKTGIVVGTTDYLAPEQLKGGPIDERADVYALGCVLYETLTGDVPYPRDSEAAVMFAHVSEPPPSVVEQVPGVPREVDDVVGRAMAKEPSDRYPSAAAMRRALIESVPGAQAPTLVDLPAAATTATPQPGMETPPPGAATPPPAAPPPPPAETLPPAAAMPPPPEPATARVRSVAGRMPGNRRLLAAIGAGVVAVGVVLAIVLSGGGGGEKASVSGAPVAPPVAESGLHWRAVHPAPTARQQVAAAVANGTIWVFGGLAGKTSTAKVEGYDPAINTWKAGPDLPLPLHHEMAVNYKGELVVMGGWVPEGDNLTAQTSDRVFVLRNGQWLRLPKLNHARAAGAAAVVGDKIVVAGGQANEKLVPQTEVYDGHSWKDVADIPTTRDHLAAVSDGRYFYAVGGRKLSSDKNSAALERYDPAADSWQKLPDLPTPRGGLGAAIVKGRLVVLGGEDPTSVIKTVQAFNLRTQKWSALPNMLTPRHGLAAVAIGSVLYALDGARVPTHAQPTPTAEVLDFASAKAVRKPPVAQSGLHWRAVHPAPTARQQVAAAVANGTIWVFGGLAGKTSTAKVEGYDPAINTWKAGPDLPLPLHHEMAVNYKGELVVMGGWVPEGDNLTAQTSDRVFVLRNGQWLRLPKLNHARAAGAAAVVGDKIVVAGGQANEKLVPQTEVYDGHSWKDVADIPTTRDHLAAVSDGRYFYAVGGRKLSSDKNSAALERYDPAADSWQKLPDLPSPRGGLGAAIVKGRLVVLGGEDPTSVIKTVQAFNLRTQKWSALPNMLTPRHGLAAVAIGSVLYALDGARVPTHAQPTPTAEVLDFG